MKCLTLNRHATIKSRSKQLYQSSQECKGLVRARMFGRRLWPATGTARVRIGATLLISGSRLPRSPDKHQKHCCLVGKSRYPKAHYLRTLLFRCSYPESRRWHGRQLQYIRASSKGHAHTRDNTAATRHALEGQR